MATKKKTAKKTAKKTGRSPGATTYKDVQTAFAFGGIEAVKAMNAHPRTIAKAHQGLITAVAAGSLNLRADHNLDDLAALIPEAKHGRRAPAVGETRDYKVQKIKDAPVFLRLALFNLGVKKGQVVSVTFEEDEIRVRRKGAGLRAVTEAA